MTDLLTALKQLRENGPYNRSNGICCQFDWLGLYSAEECRRFRASFKTWQYYSGDPSFPVPGTVAAIDACFYKSTDWWDRDTAYGRLRWDLLDHIIEELSK